MREVDADKLQYELEQAVMQLMSVREGLEGMGLFEQPDIKTIETAIKLLYGVVGDMRVARLRRLLRPGDSNSNTIG